MLPTNELRFVERKLNYNPSTGQMLGYYADVRILQQKWQLETVYCTDWATDKVTEEWRDVPAVKESAR